MSTARITLIEAIARRQTVTALYNGAQMRLAPHMLYARNDDLFVCAFNFGKKRRLDEECRLGRFKLDGLRDVTLTGQSFDPLPSFDPSSRPADEQIVLAVE